MVSYWSLKLIGSQPSYRTVRKRMNASFIHCKYKEGMERNETVKAGSSDHRVPKKRANVIYSKWHLQVEENYQLRSSGSNMLPRLLMESLNSNSTRRTVDLSPGETHSCEAFREKVSTSRQREQRRVIKGVKEYVQLKITSTELSVSSII